MIKVTHVCDLCGVSEARSKDMNLLLQDLRLTQNGSVIHEWQACQDCRDKIFSAACKAAHDRRSK